MSKTGREKRQIMENFSEESHFSKMCYLLLRDGKKCKGVGILECEENIGLDYNAAQKGAHFLICLGIKQYYSILLNFPFCLNLLLLPLEILVVPQSGPSSFFFSPFTFFIVVTVFNNHKLTESWKYSKRIIFKSFWK